MSDVDMSDVEMKLEVEAEDFAEELSDEALDRAGACLVTTNLGPSGSYLRVRADG